MKKTESFYPFLREYGSIRDFKQKFGNPVFQAFCGRDGKTHPFSENPLTNVLGTAAFINQWRKPPIMLPPRQKNSAVARSTHKP